MRPMAKPSPATIRYSLLQRLLSGVLRLRLRPSTCVFKLCCVPACLPTWLISRECCPKVETGRPVLRRIWSWRGSWLLMPWCPRRLASSPQASRWLLLAIGRCRITIHRVPNPLGVPPCLPLIGRSIWSYHFPRHWCPVYGKGYFSMQRYVDFECLSLFDEASVWFEKVKLWPCEFELD